MIFSHFSHFSGPRSPRRPTASSTYSAHNCVNIVTPQSEKMYYKKAAAAACVGALAFLFMRGVSSAEAPVRVVTKDELGERNGHNGDSIWIGILGEVYDVSSGERFYGKDGPYRIFAGRDGSVCFMTGVFTEEEAAKSVTILSKDQLLGLDNWRQSYVDNEAYAFVGVLDGELYDGTGSPTPLLQQVRRDIQEASVEAERKEAERLARVANRKKKVPTQEL